jgi:uncharacterized protein (DUF4415 family)
MKKKKTSASSQREKPHRRSGESMRGASKPASSSAEKRQQFTAKQQRELMALAALPDEQIDTSDIPELPLRAWKDAVRGKFYRPMKQAVSLRLDTDVVAWLKRPGKGYQTRANHLLRQQMLADMRKP